jgi:hypothetical protein
VRRADGSRDRLKLSFDTLRSAELVASLRDRVTTFVEPREQNNISRPPKTARTSLGILPASKLQERLIAADLITNAQVGLFDSR